VPMEAHSKQRMHESGELKCGKRDKEYQPFHRSMETATSSGQGEVAKLSEVGRSKAQKAPPDQGRDTEYDPVLER